jgi:lysine-specific demethylase 8
MLARSLQDPYYNCYVQVLGSKRVWLAPPEVGKYMLPHGSNVDSLASYMTNTSQVPILRPVDDFQQLRPAYPDFFQHVWPVCMEDVLNPGDLLIMPPGWWHAMRAEGGGVSWSVSTWY